MTGSQEPKKPNSEMDSVIKGSFGDPESEVNRLTPPHDEVQVDIVKVEGVSYILTGNDVDLGPNLLTEVQDVDGYRYYTQWWRIPIDARPEEWSDHGIPTVDQNDH